MNGGYVLIDCTGLDLTKGQTPQTISGIHKKVKTAMESGKPIYACNCNWGGKDVTPIEVFCIEFDNDIIATASTLQVVISDSDAIIINNMVA